MEYLLQALYNTWLHWFFGFWFLVAVCSCYSIIK